MPKGTLNHPVNGFLNASKSIERPPEPFFSVRMKPLAQIGINRTLLVYGDEATPDFTDSLSLAFGDTAPNGWDVLMPGYTYTFNVGRKQFAIADESGSVLAIRRVDTLHDLQIEAAVLESHQFIFLIDASFMKAVYPIVRRKIKESPTTIEVYQWGEFDRYLSKTFHAAFLRVYAWLGEDDRTGKDLYEAVGVVTELRGIVFAVVRDLAQRAEFQQNLLAATRNFSAVRRENIKRAALMHFANLLMLHAIAAGILTGFKPCVEPWMLWGMFKWAQLSTIIPREDDKIFDLSPWW